MVPRSVTAWTGLVHDHHLADTLAFLGDSPYGLTLDGLVEMTTNEIIYSGSSRHLAERDRRSEPARLWTTDVTSISLEESLATGEACSFTLGTNPIGGLNASAVIITTGTSGPVQLHCQGTSYQLYSAVGDVESTVTFTNLTSVTNSTITQSRTAAKSSGRLTGTG